MKTRLLTLIAVASIAGAQAIVPVPDKTFEFRSGFWINLDHFLTEQALADPAPPAVAPQWTAAINYYRENFVKRQPPSGQVVERNDRLSDLGNAASLKNSGLDPELIPILESAAPIYRERWWPAHDRANRAWIQAASPLVSKYSADLKRELARAFATEWPSAPIRTDVVESANWAGAYTTVDPSHITISSASPSNQGEAALEMLFHEGSHTIADKLLQVMGDEAKSQNRLYRYRDLWHAVLFYTAGTMVERHVSGYTQYAAKTGLFERGWPGAAEILEKDWKPHLDGKIDMNTAIKRMLADYGVDAASKKGR